MLPVEQWTSGQDTWPQVTLHSGQVGIDHELKPKMATPQAKAAEWLRKGLTPDIRTWEEMVRPIQSFFHEPRSKNIYEQYVKGQNQFNPWP